MMFRHAPSHRCVSSRCILVQEWRHNPRKYSLHSSLTNRHRSSSKQVQLITERHVTPLFVPHTTHNTPFPSTSELIQRHSRERYRCANTEIMTIRIWNDGNPIRMVETGSNDHSLQIAWNPHHFAFQITHIASPSQIVYFLGKPGGYPTFSYSDICFEFSISDRFGLILLYKHMMEK